MKVLFIGGPGNISTSSVEELLARGYEVGILTLPESPTHGLENQVKFYRGNRNNSDELRKAVEDFRPQLTVDVCCFTPAQAEGLIGILRGQVEKHMFVSTVDVYGYPLARIPFRECDAFNKPVSQYAANKLACEKLFWAEHYGGTIPLAIVRPAYSFGPPFVLSFFSRRGGLELISRLRAGRPVVVPGDGQTFIHPSSAYNTGRMLAEIVASPATVGQDFTCAHPSYMTGDDYYRLFAGVLNVEPVLVHMPKDWLLPLENGVIPDNLLSELTQFHIAFSVDKFARFFPEFCWKKSLVEAAREYVAYHDQKGDLPKASVAFDDDNYEDRLVQAWEEARKHFSP
jgi:nucleoside-diphosphate-sugar epimerase